jgi:hypothetical protein
MLPNPAGPGGWPLARHALAHEVVGVQLDVLADLVGQTILETAAAGQRADDGSQVAQHVTPRRAVFRAAAIARARRFQSAVSSRSRGGRRR